MWKDLFLSHKTSLERDFSHLEELEKIADALDKESVPTGVIFSSGINVPGATQDAIRALVGFTVAGFEKKFYEYYGDLDYLAQTPGGLVIRLTAEKKNCKITKIETTETQEVVLTRYVLEGDCDPLFADTSEKPKVE